MTPSADLPYPRAIPYLAIAAALAVNSGAPVWARALAGVPLVLYLPGASLVAAALPGTGRTLETHALAVAMSLACTVLLGVALGLAGHLDAPAWEAGLCLITIAGCIASFRTERQANAAFSWIEVRKHGRINSLGSSTRRRGSLPWSDLGLIAFALCIAGGAFMLARQGALTQAAAAHTDFWMVPEDADQATLATVGIRNSEGKEAAYRVDILQRGQLVDEWPPVVLKAGATYTAKVAFDPRVHNVQAGAASAQNSGPEGSRVEARLYKDGDVDVVYRKAWVALPTAPKTTATDR